MRYRFAAQYLEEIFGKLMNYAWERPMKKRLSVKKSENQKGYDLV